MPETRTEWLLFLLGLVVIGGLAFSIVRSRMHDDPTHHLDSTVSTHAAAPTTSPATTGEQTTTTSTAQAWVRLQLTAQRDTWISVQRGSATGRVLYTGTLRAGRTRAFAGPRLWVRFGGARDVSATLDGAALSLPVGTYSVAVTHTGLGTRQA